MGEHLNDFIETGHEYWGYHITVKIYRSTPTDEWFASYTIETENLVIEATQNEISGDSEGEARKFALELATWSIDRLL